MARVYLSYARPDLPAVWRIKAALLAAGHDTWLDADDVVTGESIPAAVMRGMRSADFVLVCLSTAAAERGWAAAERDTAMMCELRDSKDRILSVRLEDVAPPKLIAAIKCIDLFPDEHAFDRGIAELAQAIDANRSSVQPPPPSNEIRVFISYAHDTPAHASRVLALAQHLRRDGLDCRIDQFVLGGPPHGWAAWMEEKLRWASFVLVVGSAAYLRRYELRETEGGHGATWEGAILRRELYTQRANLRFLPILFDDARVATCLPEPLRDTTLYRLDTDYEKLLRVLTDQPAIVAAPIGPRRMFATTRDADASRPPTLAETVPAAGAAISARPMARGLVSPTPVYLNAEVRALSQQLERARARKQTLRDAGVATDEVDREIVELRKKLRDGGQLRAGDSLGDGRYLLVKPVGRGGFAVVWEGFDRIEQRNVAIKVLHQHLASDPLRRERFFRGARVMMELKHSAVVRVHDPGGEDDHFCYFVMELVPGGNLREAVLGNLVEAGRRLALILQVGEALAEAHTKRLVHRDVKPSNILLDDQGNAKLTDFDLVRGHDSVGSTSAALGTIVYAAPECVHRSEAPTARADVYGLGMTAIFGLVGKELSLSTFKDPEATIGALDCSAAVKDVLRRAVAWEPEERFADAGEMVTALKRAQAGPSPARPAPMQPADPVREQQPVKQNAAQERHSLALKEDATRVRDGLHFKDVPDVTRERTEQVEHPIWAVDSGQDPHGSRVAFEVEGVRVAAAPRQAHSAVPLVAQTRPAPTLPLARRRRILRAIVAACISIAFMALALSRLRGRGDHTQLCGNGVIEPGEECDDGLDHRLPRFNGDDRDCRLDCFVNRCGDGKTNLHGAHHEDCDDGDRIDTNACTNECKVAVCGDGILGPGEECDDHNTTDGDGCTHDCKKEIRSIPPEGANVDLPHPSAGSVVDPPAGAPARAGGDIKRRSCPIGNSVRTSVSELKIDVVQQSGENGICCSAFNVNLIPVDVISSKIRFKDAVLELCSGGYLLYKAELASGNSYEIAPRQSNQAILVKVTYFDRQALGTHLRFDAHSRTSPCVTIDRGRFVLEIERNGEASRIELDDVPNGFIRKKLPLWPGLPCDS